MCVSGCNCHGKRRAEKDHDATLRLRTIPSQWLCEWVLSGDMAVALVAATPHAVVVVVGTT